MSVSTLQLLPFLINLTSSIHRVPSLCPNYFRSCDCVEAPRGLVDVECHDMRDLRPLNSLLNHELSFRPVRLLKVLRCEATDLPISVFNYTNILRMELHCPFWELDDRALTGVESLTELRLEVGSFTAIPAAVGALSELTFLQVANGALERLGEELKNLSQLKKLFLNKNQIKTVSRYSFVGNPVLKVINLSGNKLLFLPPGLFSPCRVLEVILLQRNELRKVDGLFSVPSLKVINLRFNRLKSMDDAFKNHTELEHLNLGYNYFTRIGKEAFGEQVQHLKILRLDHCSLSTLHKDVFKSLHKLQRLYLNFNRLLTVDEELFGNLHNLQILDLDKNKISELAGGTFRTNQRLQHLRLNKNRLEHCRDAFHHLQSLKTLHLTNNLVQSISESDFSTAPLLQVLKLSSNKINRIDSDSFIHLKQLFNLTLDSNLIRTLNGSMRDLPALKSLRLHNNLLETIDKSDLKTLPSLKVLNLANNHLTDVQGAFRGLGNLKRLTLTSNRLVTLTRSSFPKIMEIREIYFSRNKWICDCRLSWLRDLVTTKYLNRLRHRVSCEEPPRFQGKALSQLSREDLEGWPDKCPQLCRCECVPGDVGYFVRVDCSGRQLAQIPPEFPDHIGELYLNDNVLENPITLNISSSAHLRLLNLERNNLTAMDFYLPRNLEVLMLAENNITRFSQYLPPTLTMCSLSGNPWICDCDTLQFRKWLMKNGRIVVDANITTCGFRGPKPDLYGKVITSLSVMQMCPESMMYYILGGVALTLTVLGATSSHFLYTRYRYHIKVWLHSRGFYWLQKRDASDVGKRYDAYVSYSDEDVGMVEQLLPELEDKEPKFSLFFRLRDEQPGMFEFKHHVEELRNSKRAIFFISEHYIRNEFLMAIFQYCFHLNLDEGLNRIILILVGDLPPMSELDQSLRVTIESTKCLRMGQKLFWEMLRFAMPKTSVKMDSVPEDGDDVPLLSQNYEG